MILCNSKLYNNNYTVHTYQSTSRSFTMDSSVVSNAEKSVYSDQNKVLESVRIYVNSETNCESPMRMAIEHGTKELVQCLILMGVHIHNVKDRLSPLHIACRLGKLESVKLLLAHGVDIEERDNESYSPLIIAAQYGYTEVVVYLIENKADYKATLQGMTAREIALKEGETELVKAMDSAIWIREIQMNNVRSLVA